MSDLNETQGIEGTEITESVIHFINVLDSLYPPRCIGRNEDVIEAHRYAAVREFIDELVAVKNDHLGGDDVD